MAVGTTENTADSGSALGSSSAAVSSSTSTSSAPMSALAAVEKAAGSLSSSDTAPGTNKPGDTAAAAGGTGTPGATPAATTQAQPVATPAAPGAVPQDRHDSAVKNARVAGQTDALRAITGEQNITPQHQADVKLGYSLIGDLRSNPKAFIENIARDLGLQIVDPRSSQQPAQGGKPGGLPPADLVSEDGKKAYSAETMMQIIDAKVKEAIEQVNGTIQPILTDRESQQKAAEQARAEAAAYEKSGNFLTQMREREHFKEYEPAILAKLKAMDPAVKQQLGAFAALQTAYLDVIREIVQPKLAADADQKVRNDYAKKAATTGSVLPNGSQPTQERQRPRNVRELSKHLESALS